MFLCLHYPSRTTLTEAQCCFLWFYELECYRLVFVCFHSKGCLKSLAPGLLLYRYYTYYLHVVCNLLACILSPYFCLNHISTKKILIILAFLYSILWSLSVCSYFLETFVLKSNFCELCLLLKLKEIFSSYALELKSSTWAVIHFWIMTSCWNCIRKL